MISCYLPLQADTALYIDKMKKALYIICEALTKVKTEELIQLVNELFSKNNKDISLFSSDYLELYLLSWEIQGFINKIDISEFRQILQTMNELTIYNMLDIRVLLDQQVLFPTNLYCLKFKKIYFIVDTKGNHQF